MCEQRQIICYKPGSAPHERSQAGLAVRMPQRCFRSFQINTINDFTFVKDWINQNIYNNWLINSTKTCIYVGTMSNETIAFAHFENLFGNRLLFCHAMMLLPYFKMASSFWKGVVGVGLFALAHAAFSAAQRELKQTQWYKFVGIPVLNLCLGVEGDFEVLRRGLCWVLTVASAV